MGFSIDNETLAIVVIVGAASLYYFTHEVQTEEEIAQKRDDARKGIAIRNYNVLGRRYDSLELQEVMLNYEKHTKTSLEMILNDAIQLQSESGDVKGLDDSFFQGTAHLIESCRSYLKAFRELDEDALEVQRKELCATQNRGSVTNVAVVHNNFDQRRQSLQQTNIQAVDRRQQTLHQSQVDARSVSFQQSNNELRQLHLHNPHSDISYNTDFPRLGGAQEVPLQFITNEGSHNQSVLDQTQTNTENNVTSPATVCGTHYVHPTAVSTVSRATSPTLIEIQETAASRRIHDVTGRKVKGGSVHEVDIFNTAPPISRDNHDRSPAVSPSPPPGGAGARDDDSAFPSLASTARTARTADLMFDEGGKSARKTKHRPIRPRSASPGRQKRKKGIPPSPAALREMSVDQRIFAVEMVDLQNLFSNTIAKLNGSTKYQEGIMRQLEGVISRLDAAVHKGGSESDKQKYHDERRPNMIKMLNQHRQKFGVQIINV